MANTQAKRTRLGPVGRLLKSSKQWVQGQWARTKSGKMAGWDSRYALCWCVDGAIAKCYRTWEAREEARSKLERVLGEPDLWTWNDKPGRTFAEVKAAVRKAGI